MPLSPTTHSEIAEGYAHLRRSQMRPTHIGIAAEFARERRRQMRASVYCRRRWLYCFATWRLLLREWRRLAALRQLRPLLKIMYARWRLEADVRIRAMMLLQRWRDTRMVHARRRRPARVLIRRSIEEWWTYMLVRRASQGGVTYPLRTLLESRLRRAIG